ncbi:hypothetical protein [Methylobacterium sp. E-046]|uniref:hypothetical protein n=1 Tax=Methylobacterium sp. E-046 TaxID=2836576 RepID=UPI001FBAD9EC|nr:hypothetical protein [Methylobacterium sp. E-046]MCJ2099361.1 hypothetical protein [Methylobacterium sp. E-046]
MAEAPTSTGRVALEQALAAVRQAEAALLTALGSVPDTNRQVGSKEAAGIWGLTEDAARKRLKRIGTRDLSNRWTAPLSLVEANRSPDAAR